MHLGGSRRGVGHFRDENDEHFAWTMRLFLNFESSKFESRKLEQRDGSQIRLGSGAKRGDAQHQTSSSFLLFASAFVGRRGGRHFAGYDREVSRRPCRACSKRRCADRREPCSDSERFSRAACSRNEQSRSTFIKRQSGSNQPSSV